MVRIACGGTNTIDPLVGQMVQTPGDIASDGVGLDHHDISLADGTGGSVYILAQQIGYHQEGVDPLNDHSTEKLMLCREARTKSKRIAKTNWKQTTSLTE